MSAIESNTRELLPPADAPATPGTELSLPQRALAAMKLKVTVEQLTELAAKTADITTITNADGRTQIHAAAMVLREERIAIDKAGIAGRDEANKFAKQVIIEAGKLIKLIKPEEERLIALRDAWDTAREAEKFAKADLERKRKEAIQSRIQSMRDRVAEVAGLGSAGVQQAIIEFTAIVIDDNNFAELKETAEAVHQNVLARLRSMHAEYVKHEEDMARIKAEQERRAAELEAEKVRQRKERELDKARMAAISAINRLPLVATTGRNPDRKAGTRECIADTLDEARNFEVSEADFGTLLDAATEAKRAAVEQIEHVLQRFDDRERQQAEHQRLDAERAAAQAEHARIAAENARQAEELRRQQESLEQQRRDQEAAAQAERDRLADEQRKIEADRQQVALLQASLAAQSGPSPQAGPPTEPQPEPSTTIEPPIADVCGEVPCKLCSTPTRALHTLLCDGCYDLSKHITVATAVSAITLGCEALGIADRAVSMLKAARKARAQLQSQAGAA
jgi:hypothetical protein